MFSFFKRTRQLIQRKSPRREADQFLTVYDEDQFIMLGRVVDLSIGGMCVVSELSIQLGNIVKLAIEVPLANGKTEIFWVDCESVWQKEKNDLNRIGFRFIHLSPRNNWRIRKIMEQQQLR